MKRQFNRLSSSQEGEMCFGPDDASGYPMALSNVMLTDIETINKASAKITLMLLDQTLAILTRRQ